MEEINDNFEALGLSDVSDIDESSLVPKPLFNGAAAAGATTDSETEEEEGEGFVDGYDVLYRSAASELLVSRSGEEFGFDGFEHEDVYRSVSLETGNQQFEASSRFLNAHSGFELDSEFGYAIGGGLTTSTPTRKSSSSIHNNNKNNKKNVSVNFNAQVSPIGKRIETAFLSATHAFAMAQSSDVLKQIVQALGKCEIDFSGFDQVTSSFHCKSFSFRFDIYVMQVGEQDQSQYGDYVIEIQRLTSGCICEWSSLTKALMDEIKPVCLEDVGYFSVTKNSIIATTAAAAAAATAASETKSSSAAALTTPKLLIDAFDQDQDQDEEDEQDYAEYVDETLLVTEYRYMLDMLLDSKQKYESKLQIAKLLNDFSGEKESALLLVQAGTIKTISQVIQSNMLFGEQAADLNTVLCAILANVAAFVSSPSDSDVTALVLHEILKNGSDDPLEIEQLRQACRALAVFAKSVVNKTQLRPLIGETIATRCVKIQDDRLAEHARSVLLNLQSCA